MTQGQTTSVDQALAHAETLLAQAPTLAARQANAVLQAVPGHPLAQLILGAALRLQGDTQASLTVLRPLAAAQPRAARAHLELGMALAGAGEEAAAIAALRRAVALAPGLADGWRMLGDLLMLRGAAEEAHAAYARQLRAAVNDPELMQAADLLCRGALPQAERALKERLKRTPTDLAAIRMLAELATRLGRNADAEALLRRALELSPDFAAARHNLAVVLFRQVRPHEAIPLVEALLAASPRDPSYRALLAACLSGTGDFTRACDVYDRILTEFPNQPKIWMSYGHALRTAGRRAESIAAYQRSIAGDPECGEAWWSLANLKTTRFLPAEIATMRAALEKPALDAEARYHLHYTLGRALEQECQYEQSFVHYAEGARLRRAQLSYSAEETSDAVERACAAFTPAFFARHADEGCADPSPIFIVGLPRSGSTLIEQILSSHSQVEGTMELPDLAVMARAIAREAGAGQYPACLDTLPAGRLRALGEEYLSRTKPHRALGRAFFIDKMPNNWIHAGLIALILPRAKIIDARRHPMAACFSAFKQHFARGQNFSYDLTELGRYYRDYVAMMAHMDATLPGRIHRVQYETMVAETEAETRRLLAYCGLDFEESCLRFWETDRAVRTASSEQVRQPIFREGLEQWRHYAPFLGALQDALGGLAA